MPTDDQTPRDGLFIKCGVIQISAYGKLAVVLAAVVFLCALGIWGVR